MEKLSYNYEVFESGAGRIYTILSRASMPALILGVALMMTINSGMFTGFANLPDFVKILFMAVIILYIVPGIFVFPTVWMLRSWKTRSLKNCYVMAGRKSVEYHKISDQTISSKAENVYVATQIKKVEETKRKYIIYGNVLEKATGHQSGELEIPKAFDKESGKVQIICHRRHEQGTWPETVKGGAQGWRIRAGLRWKTGMRRSISERKNSATLWSIWNWRTR